MSLANGLEAEVKEEMDKQGFQLEIKEIHNSKSENASIPFPFGRRVEQGEKLVDLVKDNNGALYIICDAKIIYGGQTINGKDTHDIFKNPTGTVAQYEKEFGTGTLVKIPLCEITLPKKEKKNKGR